MSELTQLQHAFYAYVTNGTSLGNAIATGDPTVYARMYASRLHSALSEDYPKLRAALGDDAFAALVRRFFQARPPTTFTLRNAGEHLSAYLTDDEQDPSKGWHSQLAALERARVEVFDGRDATVLLQDDVAALGDAMPALVLRWVPASRLVSLTCNVDDVWSAIEDGSSAAPQHSPVHSMLGLTPPIVNDQQRLVLVWRRDNLVIHRTLDDDEARLAPRLVVGASFADVCEVLSVHHGDEAAPRAVELLLRWLQGQALAQDPR